MSDSHSRVDAAIKAFAKGEIVVVTDDDDRENEGDLFVAASLCTPEKMAFVIRNTSGIVCAPLGGDHARRLHLDPMVAENDAPLGTAFTVSVDVRHGLTTGISAEERCNTVRALANDNSGAADFVRPGHVFPLIAREGGVLMRSGHTEAAVDLCKLANLPPVGVICELANDDGTVMKGPQIVAFAETHKLKRISVADLIAYRQARDRLVERVGHFQVQSAHGAMTAHVYSTPFETIQQFAFEPEAGGQRHGKARRGIERPVAFAEAIAREPRAAERRRDIARDHRSGRVERAARLRHGAEVGRHGGDGEGRDSGGGEKQRAHLNSLSVAGVRLLGGHASDKAV